MPGISGKRKGFLADVNDFDSYDNDFLLVWLS